MPTVAQIRQYLTLTVLPVLAGAAANWLVVHVHFLAAFHITSQSVAGELTQLGVFGISAGLAFLASHHILKGSYQPPTTALKPLELKPLLGTVAAPPPVVVNVHPAPGTAAAPAGSEPVTTTVP